MDNTHTNVTRPNLQELFKTENVIRCKLNLLFKTEHVIGFKSKPLFKTNIVIVIQVVTYLETVQDKWLSGS